MHRYHPVGVQKLQQQQQQLLANGANTYRKAISYNTVRMPLIINLQVWGLRAK